MSYTKGRLAWTPHRAGINLRQSDADAPLCGGEPDPRHIATIRYFDDEDGENAVRLCQCWNARAVLARFNRKAAQP